MTEISLLQSQMLKLSAIEPNKGKIEGLPKNPRFIKDAKFKKLVQSIEEHPEMTAMRELLVYPLDNGKYIIIGGNMRYRAMKELGIKDAPCKVIPQDTTIEQLQACTLKEQADFLFINFQIPKINHYQQLIKVLPTKMTIRPINTKDLIGKT